MEQHSVVLMRIHVRPYIRENRKKRKSKLNDQNRDSAVWKKESIMAGRRWAGPSIDGPHTRPRLARNTSEIFKKATIRYLDRRTRRVVWNISSSGVSKVCHSNGCRPAHEKTKAHQQRVLVSRFFFNYHPSLASHAFCFTSCSYWIFHKSRKLWIS